MEWLDGATYWHWWVIGVVFVILEVFSPAAFFLWMGVAAGFVGLLLLVVPTLGWEYQLLVFSVFSIATIAFWRMWLKTHPTETDQPRLNRRGEQYLDRLFTLDEAIVNGQGKIHVDDSTWKISGADAAAGTKIRVVGVDGVVLRVEPAD